MNPTPNRPRAALETARSPAWLNLRTDRSGRQDGPYKPPGRHPGQIRGPPDRPGETVT